MSLRRLVLYALLCSWSYAPTAIAQELDTTFNGVVDGRRVVAFSVRGAYDVGALIDRLRPYAAAGVTVLAYPDDQTASETEPLVAYVDGENSFFAERPRSSSEPPTFADTMEAATIIERGERNGALCRDGTRTTSTSRGACNFYGGLETWLYEAVKTTDPDQVVAAICSDYRLVAGSGDRCGDAGVLTPVMARLYPDYVPPEPTEDEAETPSPTERPVAPLPEPALSAPGVSDSSVDWTVRSHGRVNFTWTAALSNANSQPVRAVVEVNLRDDQGEVIHTHERIVALDAGEQQEFTGQGSVPEDTALLGRRWTFDVALTDADVPLTAAELAAVGLVVDPLAEEARITNLGDEELDLNGWTLTSMVGGESFTFRFFTLGPGETVTLTSGEGARSLLPEVYLWTSSEVWADDGDAAELRDAEGRLRARTQSVGDPASQYPAGGRRASR